MNRLQLYIAKSLRGYKSLVSFNPDDIVSRHVGDMRDALAAIDYDPLEKNIFYLVQYIDSGTLLSVLRTIPSEKLDHLAATIFIPAQMDISADQLGEAVHAITRKMSAPGMSGGDIAELRELFTREYPDAGTARVLTSSDRHGSYACSLYGGQSGRTLADYLGKNLYRADWTPHKGVLLLDAELGLGGPAPEPHTHSAAETHKEAAEPTPVRESPQTTAPAPSATEAGGAAAGMRRTIIAAAAGFAAGLLLGFCLFAGGQDEKVGRRQAQPEIPAAISAPAATTAPPVEETAPAATDEHPHALADATAYLDSNRTWTRSRMEQNSAIAGLFDDLNAMRIDRIIDKWGPQLKDSKNFGAVVRAAESSRRKNINLHREGRTSYNKPGDESIGYVGYTYWIDP